MYKYCATEESAQRQRQLEQCLQQLMLFTDYRQITISQICEQAGISRKSFYRYFGSKDDCLQALIDHAVFDGASFYMGDKRVDMVLCERFFYYWKEQAPLLDALVRNGLTVLLTERMSLYIIQEEQDLGTYLNSWIDGVCREHILFYSAGVMSLVLEWHHSGYKKSILQMSKILADLVGR